ncbi:MAG: hypothetical protein OXF02_06560 [Simkaniaceae bacterium]|nr:hypothetical protein [Simkaniaceae bacterium]
MTFFPEPLRPSNQKVDDKIVVNPVEADRKGKDALPRMLPDREEGCRYVALLTVIRGACTFCIDSSRFPRDPLLEHIEELRTLFKQLRREDCSADARFAGDLSLAVARLVERLRMMKHDLRTPRALLSDLRMVLSDIDHYHPGGGKRLGFYISNTVGGSWLPLPFREIIKTLHLEHKNNGNESVLTGWIRLLGRVAGGFAEVG